MCCHRDLAWLLTWSSRNKQAQFCLLSVWELNSPGEVGAEWWVMLGHEDALHCCLYSFRFCTVQRLPYSILNNVEVNCRHISFMCQDYIHMQRIYICKLTSIFAWNILFSCNVLFHLNIIEDDLLIGTLSTIEKLCDTPPGIVLDADLHVN